MADVKTKDPGNFEPAQKDTDFVRSFPTYEKCDVIGAGAADFNMSMLTKVGINKPGAPFKDAQGFALPGNRRLDIQKYRCLLLTKKVPEVGYRRVLDLPNYLDCRVDPPPNVSVLINEAISAYGQSANYSADTITRILQDIDDQIENVGSSAGKDQLGKLAAVINALANFPQQGTEGRILLEGTMEIVLATIESIKEILKDAFSVTGGTVDNIVNIVLNFVDMLFFIGDFLTEQRNLRNELAARILSQQRSIGLGDRKGVVGAYRITYGAGSSMQTVRAWCKAGESRTPQDVYFFPDGTTGAYDEAIRRWKATREILTTAIPKLNSLYGDDYERFFGLCFFIGAFRKVYTSDGDAGEFAYYIGDSSQSDSVLRQAIAKGNNNPVVVDLDTTPYGPGIGTLEERLASTRIEAAGCYEPDFWVPFWEDTVVGNYNNDVNPLTPAVERRELRSRLRDYMLTKWATANGPFSCAWPYDNIKYYTYSAKRIDYFASQVIGIYDFFDDWAKKAYPYMGKIKRGREISKLLNARLNTFYAYAMGGAPQGMDWTKAVLLAFLPEEAVTQFGVTTKIYIGPAPLPSQFPGVKARCPGGTSDTSCLPCSIIKGRRPVGAKVIDIPTLIKWSGDRGPFKSPEFAAWAENLRQNGYPEHYIDCIAQEVAFEPLPGANSSR